MRQPATRRAFLKTAFGAVASAVAGGAALAAPAVPGLAIGAVRVTIARQTRTLAVIAPMVAERIADNLGPRLVPGARGGATLFVELTQVLIDNGDGGTGSLQLPFGQDSGVDQLQGHVVLIGPHREALVEFPMLANSGATFRSSLRMFPDPRRLENLARAFAWWTVGKLD